MPSPIGHSLAGLSGFFLIRYQSKFSHYLSNKWLILISIVFANLPDIDFFLSYLLFQNFNQLHRQFTHSFLFGLFISFGTGYLIKRKINLANYFSLWLLGLYYSHILLDMLAYDSQPPRGVQCFFPFDTAYYEFPFTILGKLKVSSDLVNWTNISAILQEIIVIPLIFILFFSLSRFIKRQLAVNEKH